MNQMHTQNKIKTHVHNKHISENVGMKMRMRMIVIIKYITWIGLLVI